MEVDYNKYLMFKSEVRKIPNQVSMQIKCNIYNNFRRGSSNQTDQTHAWCLLLNAFQVYTQKFRSILDQYGCCAVSHYQLFNLRNSSWVYLKQTRQGYFIWLWTRTSCDEERMLKEIKLDYMMKSRHLGYSNC